MASHWVWYFTKNIAVLEAWCFFPRNMGCQPRDVFNMFWEGCEKYWVPFLKSSMLLVIEEGTNICIHIGQNTLRNALGARAQSCTLWVVELKDSVNMEVCLLRLRKSNIPNQSLEITWKYLPLLLILVIQSFADQRESLLKGNTQLQSNSKGWEL